MRQKPDPLHIVQGQFFSNAFSNAGDYVWSPPNAPGFRVQYGKRTWSPSDASELVPSRWHRKCPHRLLQKDMVSNDGKRTGQNGHTMSVKWN